MEMVNLSLRDSHVPAEVPRAALVISTILSMVTFAVLAVCLSKFGQALILKIRTLTERVRQKNYFY